MICHDLPGHAGPRTGQFSATQPRPAHFFDSRGNRQASNVARGSSQLLFSAQGGTPFFYQAMGKLEQHSIVDTLLKELLGINLPKIIFTRSKDERIDAAVSEIGNTVGFAVGGLAVNKAFKLLLDKALTSSQNQVLAKRWAVVAKSLGIYSVVFSALWAMPFVRNWYTAKRVGADRFTEVIGAKAHTEQQHHKPNLDQNIAYYKKTAQTILAGGAVGVLFSALLGVAGVRSTYAGRKALAPGMIKQLFEGKNLYQALFKPNGKPRPFERSVGQLRWESLLLPEGKFSNFGGLPALLFWGVPAYLGWLHASRDRYERKEQLLKFANFTACFFGPSMFINSLFSKKLKPILGTQAITYENIAKVADPQLRSKALRLWAGKNTLGLLSSILLLGTMPQLINIYLTNKRLQRAQRQHQKALVTTRHVLRVPLPPD